MDTYNYRCKDTKCDGRNGLLDIDIQTDAGGMSCGHCMQLVEAMPEPKRKRPSGQNARRSRWARRALKAGTDYNGERNTKDVATYIADLVANLQHLCREKGIDWDDCLRRGNNHFEAEKTEDQ